MLSVTVIVTDPEKLPQSPVAHVFSVNTAADAVAGINAAPATITATAANPDTLIAPPVVVNRRSFGNR
jgi:hypothetical protein